MGLLLLFLFSALEPHPQVRRLKEKQKGKSVSAWLPSNTVVMVVVRGYNKGINVITSICTSEKGGQQNEGQREKGLQRGDLTCCQLPSG